MSEAVLDPTTRGSVDPYTAARISAHEAAFAASGEGALSRIEGWFLADSGTGLGDLNHAVALVGGVDVRIPEEWFAARGVGFEAIIQEPVFGQLAESLRARGYRETERQPLMTRSLVGFAAPAIDGVVIETVDGEASIRRYLEARRDRAKEAPPDDVEVVFVANAIGSGRFRYFVAMRGDEPIGTSMAVDCGDLVSVNNVFVREDARRMGIGAALTGVAMSTFPGAKEVFLEATEMGARLYDAMGFERRHDMVRLAPATVSLRLMTHDGADYALMSRWLSDPRVLEWYEGRDKPHSVEMVAEHYSPQELAAEATRANIIELNEQPAGYLQFYPVQNPADYEIEDATGTWAIDLFLGEPSAWSTGAGSAVLRKVLRKLFEVEGATRVLIDPRVDNPRAIRAYEKVGFRKVKVLAGHEFHEGADRDCWLMEVAAESRGQ